jgi:hypothetical protein
VEGSWAMVDPIDESRSTIPATAFIKDFFTILVDDWKQLLEFGNFSIYFCCLQSLKVCHAKLPMLQKGRILLLRSKIESLCN